MEVPLAVQQPDRHQGNPEIAGRLQMVAGEDAESSRVLGQGLGQPELRREVGDEVQRGSPASRRWNQRASVERLEVLSSGVHLLDERRVGGEPQQPSDVRSTRSTGS